MRTPGLNQRAYSPPTALYHTRTAVHPPDRAHSLLKASTSTDWMYSDSPSLRERNGGLLIEAITPRAALRHATRDSCPSRRMQSRGRKGGQTRSRK